MADDAARAWREARLTWLVGGWLLIGAGAVQLFAIQLATSVGVILPLRVVELGATSAAMVVFAIGLGAGGSVVARRPLGVIALLVLAVWPAVSIVIWSIVAAGSDDPTADVGPMIVLNYLTLLVPLAAALIAVTQIARAGVVPHRFRWAPAIGLACIVAVQLIFQVASVVPGGGQNALIGLASLAQIVQIGVPVALGILAVVLASRRPDEGSVQVYPPAP